MEEVVDNPLMSSLWPSYEDANFLEKCFLFFLRKGLKMVAGSHYIPKDIDSKPLGEDAHFISVDRQTIGIADGVGAWARNGIDAGEYARKLMENCIGEIRGKPTKEIVPKLVLKEAFDRTDEKGSSTACVLTVKDDLLHAVNVGDSGFVVVRGGMAVYESPVQQHEFNCPFQLGKNGGDDCPDSGLVITVPVEAGDVIVTGTDGLFDNVYLDDLENLVREGTEDGVKAKDLALRIAQFAREKALSGDLSPYARAAQEAGVELKYTGGKYDDITVVVSYVVPSPSANNPLVFLFSCFR